MLSRNVFYITSNAFMRSYESLRLTDKQQRAMIVEVTEKIALSIFSLLKTS
jgi:hypothetical protein